MVNDGIEIDLLLNNHSKSIISVGIALLHRSPKILKLHGCFHLHLLILYGICLRFSAINNNDMSFLI